MSKEEMDLVAENERLRIAVESAVAALYQLGIKPFAESAHEHRKRALDECERVLTGRAR